MLNRNRSLHL